MGERPTNPFIERKKDSSTGSSTPSIPTSLELAAMATAARRLLEGTAPAIIGGDERVWDPQGLERAVSLVVFGPSQIDIIPTGPARLVVSLGLTESKNKPQHNKNSGH